MKKTFLTIIGVFALFIATASTSQAQYVYKRNAAMVTALNECHVSQETKQAVLSIEAEYRNKRIDFRKQFTGSFEEKNEGLRKLEEQKKEELKAILGGEEKWKRFREVFKTVLRA